MNIVVLEPDSAFEIAALGRPRVMGGPLGELPQLNRRQLQLERALRRLVSLSREESVVSDLSEMLGASLKLGEPEFTWRASGIQRPNLVAQLISPTFASRVGLGVETPLAHAVIDGLLGFERLEAERRLQLTPVEWGVWTYLLARSLTGLREKSAHLELRSFVLDRVGPDPFDVRGLGQMVTIRWPLTLASVEGSIRLWLPETFAARLVETWVPPLPSAPELRQGLGNIVGIWKAEAGTIDMPRGLGKLRVGGVLPIPVPRITGTPRDPKGKIQLVLETRRDGRYWFEAAPVPNTGGARLTLLGPLSKTPAPREALAVTSSPEPAPPHNAGVASADVPVTLVVELGRLSLSLSRLADLKPGDVVELGRHSREPVELTSGGRLVARGELVQIDTELGIRVTSVFM